ncbi:hypothetical protein BD324DRAFT_18808 [Kockovaella imperatae]|uniref:CsbD-like domain-containing protein n=1 Tax=Kockovaella imperatae TaxID=4999 RepID=A0A1Y1US11_9TREE|nr:hypothetical protein BD324DRAFT_18808 [Kockovaella imperatae]ORX40752.1 hypothetical protein BD324DRAFT_18808 [Kockovaella imperatae]
MASVTAISRGHEGVRHSTTSSPLANDANVSGPNDNSLATGAAEGAGVAGATALVGSLALKDSAPGRHEDGVGHPSTRAPETTREPGSYPKADLSGEADHDHKPSTMTSTESKNATSTASAAGGLGPAGTVAPDSDRAQTQTPTTTSNQSHTTAGHDGKRRTSSGGSSKKKVGFMSKLKGEIKVISGKLDHDKEKVEAGKRMIHGGE